MKPPLRASRWRRYTRRRWWRWLWEAFKGSDTIPRLLLKELRLFILVTVVATVILWVAGGLR